MKQLTANYSRITSVKTYATHFQAQIRELIDSGGIIKIPQTTVFMLRFSFEATEKRKILHTRKELSESRTQLNAQLFFKNQVLSRTSWTRTLGF